MNSNPFPEFSPSLKESSLQSHGSIRLGVMSQIFSGAGAFVDRIKINTISREMREGRPVWIKCRRWGATPLVACANSFFRLAGNPVRALARPDVWQRWEVDCFLSLHGDGYRAFAVGDRQVAADEVPGVNLTCHLDGGTITPPMVVAAAQELRRAHARYCADFGGLWSHGDPHVGNFIYDEATGRARLIDFEVMHHPAMPAEERHADDLLVFIQDMVGRISGDLWMPSARAFLKAYGDKRIIGLLRSRLIMPQGMARVWWAVRTTFMAPGEVERRINALRAEI
jgi:hypothetical protein